MKLLKRFSYWIYQKVNGNTLLVAGIIFLFFLIFILPNEAQEAKKMTGSNRSPDTSYIYSLDDLYQMAKEYGSKGRSYYIQTRFRFDIIWPFAYLFFFLTTLTLVLKPLSQSFRLLHLLPLGGALFDFLENFAVSLVMYRYPLLTPGVVHLAPFFTFMKWNLIGLSIVVFLFGVIYRWRRMFTSG